MLLPKEPPEIDIEADTVMFFGALGVARDSKQQVCPGQPRQECYQGFMKGLFVGSVGFYIIIGWRVR